MILISPGLIEKIRKNQPGSNDIFILLLLLVRL